MLSSDATLCNSWAKHCLTHPPLNALLSAKQLAVAAILSSPTWTCLLVFCLRWEIAWFLLPCLCTITQQNRVFDLLIAKPVFLDTVERRSSTRSNDTRVSLMICTVSWLWTQCMYKVGSTLSSIFKSKVLPTQMKRTPDNWIILKQKSSLMLRDVQHPADKNRNSSVHACVNVKKQSETKHRKEKSLFRAESYLYNTGKRFGTRK